MSRHDLERVIDAFFDTVTTAAGSFSVTQRPARRGRNPRTGEPVGIAASRAMRFSASTALRSALNPAPKRASGLLRGSTGA
ncbi:MAG TPA: HU family DNA-binding protein [Acidimicrobiales bacterium]|nr:HU family DNA-binding protein [Acidimicrobiales bacterium]